MASYVEKVRRQFTQKQKPGAPPIEDPPKVAGPPAPKVEDAAVPKIEKPSDATSPPAPTVTEPSDEVGSDPVLDIEDQRFLERLAAIAAEPEGTPPPLPQRKTTTIDGADKVALPTTPEPTADASDKGKEKATEGGLNRKKTVMSYFPLSRFNKKDGDKAADKPSRDKKMAVTEQEKKEFAKDLDTAAEDAKAAELNDAQKEEKELTDVLDQLNMSAVNNRVFSFSKESEELLNKFTQVLKDLVNGVPTAYNDLEKLFTDYDNQLKKMYGNLPPFLQNLVKSLPAKLTAALGPELMAAQSEKPGADAKAARPGIKSKRSKMPGIPSVPSLKSLATAQGAVATALKAIVNFLKFRFPMLATGTNVIMSLAVFILLFVFWYCHKRGRETRLEKERLAAEEGQFGHVSSASVSDTDDDSIFDNRRRPRSRGGRGRETPPQAPLIIGDEREPARIEEMPSVAHLPDPQSGRVPETAPPPRGR